MKKQYINQVEKKNTKKNKGGHKEEIKIKNEKHAQKRKNTKKKKKTSYKKKKEEWKMNSPKK